jgi:prepilin-type N-terminal cleavage/methylation domain-containing protein
MKISGAISSRKANAKIRCPRIFCPQLSTFNSQLFSTSAFTMIEIAICLAIIGIALVAIIGVLPLGMNTQRDNREETIINQDATVLLEAVRNGTHGMDDLTNYVIAITNYWTEFDSNRNVTAGGGSVNDGYTFQDSGVTKVTSFFPITNGVRIVGLLSTPELTDFYFNQTNNLYSGGYSNHVYVTVRSLSGLATEKPPQDNSIMLGDTFTYRILCANVSALPPMDTNTFANYGGDQSYNRQLSANEHELRMTFYWPLQPNGKLGIGRQTFRATVAGQLSVTNLNNQPLYFYQPQIFLADTNLPTAP